MGFIAAVAFATILAVVAGLTLSGATTISHDLYINASRKGNADEKKEVKVAKIATLSLGLVAIMLGLIFKGQNVAFMVGLAFAIAASANFPALILSILWQKFSTRGAVFSIVTGTVLSVLLIILSPTVWVDVFGMPVAVFPIKNPAIISLPGAFLAGYIGSVLFPEPEAVRKFDEVRIRTHLGLGAH
jgi:cation/acetate symporter